MPTINKPKRKYYGSDKEAYKKRQKIYQNPLWQKMRLAKLMEHPTCAVCEMMGKIKLAEHVHHLRSFVKGKTEAEINQLAFDFNNLVPVCSSCHRMLHNDKRFKYCTTLEDIKQIVLSEEGNNKVIEQETEEEKDTSKKQLNSFIF